MKVTVEPFNTADFWRLSGPIKLRIYANQSFWTSDGQYIPRGTKGAANTAYLEVTCAVAGNVLTIPEIELDSTVDGLDSPWATYSAEFVAGGRRVTFLDNFAINTLAAGDPSTTWAEILILRNLLVPQTITDSLVRQINALVTLAVGNLNKSSETNLGVVAITENAIDVAFPIAVSANDPLWLALLAGSGLLVESDTAVIASTAAGDSRVTVANAAVTADSKIFPASQDAGVTGTLRIENVVPGVSFDIVSNNGGDNGTVAWTLTN